MNNELFTSICNGDINNSILLSTKMLFLNDTIDSLEVVYIDICSYIGTYISIYDISKLIDIYSNTKKIIETDKLIIKDIYVLITKMCILCDIYNKYPSSKGGNLTIQVLKNKISTILCCSEMQLSTNGIKRFECIIPSVDNENYASALKIIAVIIKTIKSTDDISIDNSDKILDISNNIRLLIDYILRKKYKFETKFYSSDNDISWFIWGIFSILYKDDVFDDAFILYNHEFKKKYKTKRIGLLWSLGIIAIYTNKKEISNGWSNKEKIVIEKIEDISIKLYNEIKKNIMKENPKLSEKKEKEKVEIEKNDGLDYISKYVPFISSGENEIIKSPSQNDYLDDKEDIDDNPRIISC